MKLTTLKYLLLAPLALVAGCYAKRWTPNFDQFPDINDQRSAIVDETGMSEADRERINQQLRDLAAEPEATYRINAGDKITIVVYDHSDLNTTTVVTPDGNIGMVFLGEVKIAGLTLAEASKKIEDGLSEFLKRPAVGLFPLEIASQSAAVVGAVQHSGLMQIYNGMRLSDVYAKAGGSAVRNIDGQWLDVVDLIHSFVIRKGKLLPVDFRKAIEQGDELHNIKLRSGDYVFFASRTESMVCLIGDVVRPHKRIWDPSLGLLEILTTGGWVKEQYWPYVILIRGTYTDPHMYKIDVDAILTGRAPNIMMLPSDVVFVPHDNISEYNVFVRKLVPTAQIVSTIFWPVTLYRLFY